MRSKKNKQQYWSTYKNYCVAKKGKVLLTNFADFAISFIASFLVFSVIGYPIFVASSSSLRSSVSAVGKELDQITLSTHLNAMTSDGELKSGDTMAQEYVVTLMKTSYYLSGEKILEKTGDTVTSRFIEESETFLNTSVPTAYPNDRISYYFYEFKPHSDDLNFYTYNGVDYSEHKEDVIYQIGFGYSSLDHFEKKTESVPVYQQLKFAQAQQLNDYFVYSTSDTSTTNLYNDLANSFQNARQFFVNEVETKYGPYLQKYQQFNSGYSLVALGTNLAAILSFAVGFSLMEFVFPLFLKNHRTVSARMMKIGYSRIDEGEIGPKEIAIKGVVRFLEYLGSMFFALYFMGISSMSLFGFGGFAFAYLYFASMFAAVISFCIGLFTKNHQCLPELCAGILSKDLNEMEAGDPLEEKTGKDGKAAKE